MEAVFNFLGVLVWPLALALFFWPLRARLTAEWPNISQLAKNLRRGRAVAPGFEFEFELAEQQQSAAKDAPQEIALPASVPPISDAQRAALDPLKNQLLEQVNVYPEPQRMAILLDALGRARLQAGHEFVYNRIFGSQIAALERLREVGSASEVEAREFFEPVAAAHREFYETYPFEKWAGFLVNLGLVFIEAGRYRLTPFGAAFLDYIEGLQLSKAKVL